MLFRSIIFYLLWGIWTTFVGIFSLPYLFFPSKYLKFAAKMWIRGIFFLLKYVCNITHEIQGLENITSEPVIIASKHQSAFETFALYYYIPKSLFIHKKQLFWIPIFGQYLKKINMISINRSESITAIRKITKEAEIRISQGYSIIIFPEGTRKKPGEVANYKPGFVSIYNKVNCKILPVALNSGKYWPKKILIENSGKIIIKILKPIPANLNKKEVLIEVQSIIEKETSKII